MKFNNDIFGDLVLIEPSVHNDSRGFFSETYRDDKLSSFLKNKIFFCQENESKSLKNVFRGLHFQIPPYDQSKLIRVINGSIIDIVVDMRKNSKNYSKFFSIKLSSKNKKQLFIPSGYAHGFFTVSEFANIIYKVDNYYSKDHDRSLNVYDKSLKIDILPKNIIISDKDKNALNLNHYKNIF